MIFCSINNFVSGAGSPGWSWKCCYCLCMEYRPIRAFVMRRLSIVTNLLVVLRQVNFGHVTFPDNVEVPQPTVVGQFSDNRTISSGNVTVVDVNTINVKTFTCGCPQSGKFSSFYFLYGSCGANRVTPRYRDRRSSRNVVPFNTL